MQRLPASGTWDARHPAMAAAGALVPLIAGAMTGAGLTTTAVLAVALGLLVGAVGAAKLPPWRDPRFRPYGTVALILLTAAAGGVVAGVASR